MRALISQKGERPSSRPVWRETGSARGVFVGDPPGGLGLGLLDEPRDPGGDVGWVVEGGAMPARDLLDGAP
jgi:hypothetical protein